MMMSKSPPKAQCANRAAPTLRPRSINAHARPPPPPIICADGGGALQFYITRVSTRPASQLSFRPSSLAFVIMAAVGKSA